MIFELNLNREELEKRTDKDVLIRKKMLDENSIEYNNLADGDKEALKYLVKAANYANIVYMKQDNELNLPFLSFLEDEIKKGNKEAELTKNLFDAQLGVIGIDSESNKLTDLPFPNTVIFLPLISYWVPYLGINLYLTPSFSNSLKIDKSAVAPAVT